MLTVKFLFQGNVLQTAKDDAEHNRKDLIDAVSSIVEGTKETGEDVVIVIPDKDTLLVQVCIELGVHFIFESDEVFKELVEEKVKEAAKEAAKELSDEVKNEEQKEDNEEQMDKDINNLKEEIEGIFKILSKDKIKKILNDEASVAYDTLGNILCGEIKELEELTGCSNSLSERVQELKNNLDTKVKTVEGKYANVKKVMYKIGSLILQVAKVVLGICKFAFDTVTITGTAVARTGVFAANEIKYAGKTIARSFKSNVLGRK